MVKPLKYNISLRKKNEINKYILGRKKKAFRLNGVKYRVVKKIGEGGFGKVYAVMSPDNKPAVIKVMKDESIRSALDNRLFKAAQKEMRIFGQLYPTVAEENVVRVQNKVLCLMPHVAGVESFEKIGKYREDETIDRVSLSHRMHGLSTLFEQFERLHANDHIHGDVKLSNMMIAHVNDQAGQTRPYFSLIDFGLSTNLRGKQSFRGKFGTHRIVAPEVEFFSRSYYASDIYSSVHVVMSILGENVDNLHIIRRLFKDGRDGRFMFNAIKAPMDQLNNNELDVVNGLRSLCGIMLNAQPYSRPTAAELVIVFQMFAHFFEEVEKMERFQAARENGVSVLDAIAISQQVDEASIFAQLSRAPAHVVRSHFITHRISDSLHDLKDHEALQQATDQFNQLDANKGSEEGGLAYQDMLRTLASQVSEKEMDKIHEKYGFANSSHPSLAQPLQASQSEGVYQKGMQADLQEKWDLISQLLMDLNKGYKRNGVHRVLYEHVNQEALRLIRDFEQGGLQEDQLREKLVDQGVVFTEDFSLQDYISDLSESQPEAYYHTCLKNVEMNIKEINNEIDESSSMVFRGPTQDQISLFMAYKYVLPAFPKRQYVEFYAQSERAITERIAQLIASPVKMGPQDKYFKVFSSLVQDFDLARCLRGNEGRFGELAELLMEEKRGSFLEALAVYRNVNTDEALEGLVRDFQEDMRKGLQDLKLRYEAEVMEKSYEFQALKKEEHLKYGPCPNTVENLRDWSRHFFDEAGYDMIEKLEEIQREIQNFSSEMEANQSGRLSPLGEKSGRNLGSWHQR